MGEPLDNLDEVLQALEIMTADYGYAWSPKRITLSTVGLRKGLKRFIEESDCHLAISLHSPLAVQRSELMPAEKGYSITEMVELLKNYDFSKQRQRFAHAHHHDICQLVPFRQRMNLIDNLTGGQVGLITLFSGHAELAVHLAAYL